MPGSSHQIRLMQGNNSPNSISKAKAQEEIRSPNSDGEEKRLPREIWLEIGKRLQSRLDVLRFRSVCRTWRRYLPPPLRFPLRVPRPPARGPSSTGKHLLHFFIAEVTFYAAANEMIVLFEEESRGGKFSASAFVHQSVIGYMKFELPSVNEIRNLSFLCNAYHVHESLQRHSDGERAENVCNLDVLKIVIICSDGAIVNPNYPRLGDLKVVAHLIDRKLAVLSLRGGAMNNNWETDFCNTMFEDIVNYRGQLYCVDKIGAAFVMDYNSLAMTKVAPPFPCSGRNYELYSELRALQGNAKILHLAVVSEDLYLFINDPDNKSIPTPFKLSRRVYKLNSRIGKWVAADRDLPGQVFIQNVLCNFAVARGMLYPHSLRYMGRQQYCLPRACSWPEFDFVRVAVGFTNAYQSCLRGRQCDVPSLPYL